MQTPHYLLIIEWAGPVLLIASLTRRDPVHLRVLNIAASVVFLVFNVMIGLTSMVLLNVVLIAINARALRQFRTVDQQPDRVPTRPATRHEEALT